MKSLKSRLRKPEASPAGSVLGGVSREGRAGIVLGGRRRSRYGSAAGGPWTGTGLSPWLPRSGAPAYSAAPEVSPPPFLGGPRKPGQAGAKGSGRLLRVEQSGRDRGDGRGEARRGNAALLAEAKPLQPASAEVPRRPRPKRSGEGPPFPGLHLQEPTLSAARRSRLSRKGGRDSSALHSGSEGRSPVKFMQTSELAAQRLLFLCAPG